MGRHKLMEDDELLSKVREIVMRDGISVSSHKLAKEIGISNSVLFQRFGSKVNLLFAAMTPPAPDMDALLKKGADRNPCAHLEQIIWGLLEYFRKVVPVVLPLSMHPSFNYEDFRKRYPNSALDKLMMELMAVLQEKHQKGEIDCPDVAWLGSNLVAIAFSYAMFEKIGVHPGQFTRDVMRPFARLLWRGVAPAGQRGLPPRK